MPLQKGQIATLWGKIALVQKNFLPGLVSFFFIARLVSHVNILGKKFCSVWVAIFQRLLFTSGVMTFLSVRSDVLFQDGSRCKTCGYLNIWPESILLFLLQI